MWCYMFFFLFFFFFFGMFFFKCENGIFMGVSWDFCFVRHMMVHFWSSNMAHDPCRCHQVSCCGHRTGALLHLDPDQCEVLRGIAMAALEGVDFQGVYLQQKKRGLCDVDSWWSTSSCRRVWGTAGKRGDGNPPCLSVDTVCRCLSH